MVDIPFRNPFLLSVITAVALFRARKDGEKQQRSTESIDSNLLHASSKEWWKSCEARVG